MKSFLLGNIWQCLDGGWGSYWHREPELRDAVKHPTMHGTTYTNKEL